MYTCINIYFFIYTGFDDTNSCVASSRTGGLCSAGLFLGITIHDPMHHMLCPHG